MESEQTYLDEIIEEREAEAQFESEKTSETRDKEEQAFEQRLTDAIMAKMSIRKSNVEETIRKGDILRPQGISPEKAPSRSDDITSFRSTLQSADNLGAISPDSFSEDEVLAQKIDSIIAKRSIKPKGKNGYKVEIEASFGGFGPNKKGHHTFFAGIKSHSDFVELREFLTSVKTTRGKKELPMFSDVIEVEDVVEIMKDPENPMGNIRLWYDMLYPEHKTFERKIRNNKNSVEIKELGVRVSYSTENQSGDFSSFERDENLWKPHLIRNRRRTSFATRDTTHPFFGFQVDTTAVTESYISYDKNGEAVVDNKTLKYEVEIEIKSSTTTKTAKEFLDLIVFVYKGMIKFHAPVNVEKDVFYTTSDRKIVVDIHNSLFSEDIVRTKWRNNTGYTFFDKTYWNKPVNIKMENLLPHYINEERSTFHLATSVPTLKLNGKRMFLLFLEDSVWLIAPPYKLAKFGTHSLGEKAAGTYLDGEYFKGTFYVFDILFDAGKNVKKMWFENRYALAEKYVNNHITTYYGDVTIKKFHTKGDIYERLRAAAEEYEERSAENPEDVDGIIIQPANEYINKNTFKWKPAEMLTIDFRMNSVPENMLGDEMYPGVNSSNIDRAFVLTVGYDGQIFNPKPVRNAKGEKVTFNGIIFVDDNTEHAKWADTICECRWDGETFVPVRIRDDRFQPNNFTTAFDVWRDIHNPIALTTITGEDLVAMRKMHNKIKGATLHRFLKEGDSIIDIGSGRGGDLNKWRKLKLSKIFSIEPNEENAVEFNRRLESDKETFKNMPDIKLLEVGAQDTEDITEAIAGTKIKAIVSFFSLTFFGKSEAIYNGLMETIKLIPDGGYFFGAVMDGERVYKLLMKERVKQSRSFEIIKKEMKEIEDESIILMKNPARNKPKIDMLGKRLEVLREESYEFMSHIELTKLIRNTQKLVDADKKKLRAVTSEEGSREKDRLQTTINNREAFIEKLEVLLERDEVQPLEEDDTVIFNNGVFEIEQLSELDMSENIGNEISITISDPTSMVKNQVEWLFNFNIFVDRMNAAGFELVESRFIDGKDVSFLSKEAFTFSALNRVFCFRKGSAYEEVLPNNVGQVINLPAAKEKNTIIKLVGTKYGSFLHSILFAVDKKYQALKTQEEKDEYVLKMRKDIADEVTLEEFEKLHGGEMAKRMAYQISKVKGWEGTEDEALAKAFEQYRERLTNEIAEVGDVSLLEVLSQRFNVAIYIIGVRDTEVITDYYYSSNKVYCEEVLNHKTAIILAKSDEFYLVGSGQPDGAQRYIYKNADPFIKKLYGRVCGKK